MRDLISRQAAIDALGEKPLAWTEGEYELGLQNQWQSDVDALNGLPSAQPEINCSEFPNNSDTISRQAAIDALNRECCYGAVIDHCGLETAMDIISELPPAEPKRIRGRWTCDQCGYMNNIEGINFCPKCGRKM